MTMTHAFPPLIDAYLDDLDRALVAADPRERAETLAAVRDHAVELLARHGSDGAAARRVLTELGPVETIAASATPRPAPAPAAPARFDAVDVVLPVITVVLVFIAPVTLVWAIVRLVRGVGSRSLQWLTIVLAALPTLFVLFMGVLVTSDHLMDLVGR